MNFLLLILLSLPIASPRCTNCAAGKYVTDYPTCTCAQCPASKVTVSSGLSTCSFCPQGKYIHARQIWCYACNSGTYSSSESGVCLPCEAGTVVVQPSYQNGATACDRCAPGTFMSATGSLYCDVCEAGTFTSSFSFTICTNCARGSYSLQNFSSCLGCSAGSFASQIRATECTLCGLGTYSDQPLSSSCLACPPGTGSKIGAVNCAGCSRGTYLPTPTSPSCLDCLQGTFASADGASACLPCPPGRFMPFKNASSCLSCSPGLYSQTPGSTQCLACKPGTSSAFPDAPSESSCLPCPPGSFQSQPQSTQCALCQPGSFQDLENSTYCQLCAPGTFSTVTGLNRTCTLACSPGTFSSQGQTACDPCSTGSTYMPTTGASQCSPCTLCPGGFFYSSTCNSTSDSSCSPCAQCPVGTFQTSPCLSGSTVQTGQDRNCTLCSTCELGVTYKSSGCVNGEPLVCTPCTQCGDGMLRACTITSNTVCVEGMHCRKNYTFQKFAWITQEETCPQGQYLSGVEVSNVTLQKQKKCTQCPSYLYGPNGLWCEPCKGYRFPYWDSTACMCGVNTVPDESGICVCPQGFSFSEMGCRPCDLNTYSNASLTLRDDWYNQAKACSACPDGTYMHAYQGTHCLTCERGKYRNSDLYACLPCAQGFWATDPANQTSCVPCAKECPLGTYYSACPANSDPSLYECSPCPSIHPIGVFTGYVSDSIDTGCAWECPEGFYRTEQDACEVCADNPSCPPGYNLTKCSKYADFHCDVPCDDPAKPLQSSVWVQGCEWGCEEGYEKVLYDYVLWSSWDCAPKGSVVFT